MSEILVKPGRRPGQRNRAAGKLPEWKYSELIASFGTANQLADRLRQEGLDAPPRGTILGWRQRNAVPGRWAPLLIQLAMWDGVINGIGQLRKNP